MKIERGTKRCDEMKRLRCIHNVTTNEILSGIHMVEVGSNLSESDDYQ